MQARVIAAVLLFLQSCLPCFAGDWQTLDRQIRSRVYRVNVAVRITLRDRLYAQLADLSPTKHYPVFATTTDDKGMRVVGYGSCFPVHTIRDGGTYFLTNEHVVDFGDGMIEECQRFFAAMRLHAELTAALQSPEERYHELLMLVNLALKKGLSGGERLSYQATVDAIWQTYDDRLSLAADPSRALFHKYLTQSGCTGVAGFFIHEMGSSAKSPLEASLYKRSPGKPDLAVLYVRDNHLPALDLSTSTAAPGETVQAIGYPAIKQVGVLVPQRYEPTVTPGRVERVSADKVEFQAPVSRGDSGGPLVDAKGKVIGVVARRALLMRGIDAAGNQDDRFASAISAETVRAFAPELFR